VEYGFPEILELVQFKREHGEKSAMPVDLDKELRARWDELEELLVSSAQQSLLPDEASNRDDLSDWLRRLRRF